MYSGTGYRPLLRLQAKARRLHVLYLLKHFYPLTNTMKNALLTSMRNGPILIVEDNDDNRTVFKDLLEAGGYVVKTCTNGREALDFLGGHPEPSLILLNLRMPIMDGREFMIEFKKRPITTLPIPVYMLTGEEYVNAQKMGCEAFIKKPFSCDVLLSIARKHCENNKSNKLQTSSST